MLGTRSQKTTPVSRSLLRDLAVDLGTKWRELGKILGLANSVLNYFDMQDLSLSGKGNAMLGEWKRLNGDDATMEVLQEALTKIDMGHLMENVAGTFLRCWKIKQTHKIEIELNSGKHSQKKLCLKDAFSICEMPGSKKKDGDDLANCVFLSVRTVVVKKNRNNAI